MSHRICGAYRGNLQCYALDEVFGFGNLERLRTELGLAL